MSPIVDLQAGDLAFDVGANIGKKTEELLRAGARVVAFEPQPKLAELLRSKFGENPNVVVVEKALSDRPGKATLSVCSAATTISTFSAEWKQARFRDFTWDQEIEVETVTLDQMIERFGKPRFCKLDVEGFERQVLLGLSHPLPLICFEFTIEFLENAARCMERLADLGYTEFNLALGETDELALQRWRSADEVLEGISQTRDPLLWGDIYARHGPQAAVQAMQAERRADASSFLDELSRRGLWRPGQPLRLHLGCDQRLQGYVNVGRPSSQPPGRVWADLEADIAEVVLPERSVDEIRSRDLFGRFGRVSAMAQLIRWQRWLRVGGKLHIETPDLISSARTLLSDAPWSVRAATVRHLASDQAADHWFAERFERVLPRFGFACVRAAPWPRPQEPHLCDVRAEAVKAAALTVDQLLRAGEEALEDGLPSRAMRPGGARDARPPCAIGAIGQSVSAEPLCNRPVA